MEELKIFENEEFDKLRNITRNMKYGGFLYVLEYGKYVKIGCTKNPDKRMRQLKISASNYCDVILGRLWISTEHTNYKETEVQAQHLFPDVRKKGTELFSISFEKAIYTILSSNIIYKNENELIEEDARRCSNIMKNFVLNGYTPAVAPLSTTAGSKKETPEEIMAMGLFAAKEIIKRKDEKIKNLENKIKELINKLD